MSKTTLTTQFHAVYSCHYHLVMVTKYRRNVLSAKMLGRFSELAKERTMAWEGELYECSGEADHVHLMLSLPPKVAVADFVNALKTGTSRRLRKEFADEINAVYKKPTLWSRSYCVITCGGAPLATLQRYIQGQDSPDP